MHSLVLVVKCSTLARQRAGAGRRLFRCGPSMLLVTDDDRMGELVIPPEHAGDVYAFVVEATGEDDLQCEDLLVSSLPPALTVAVYRACTLRRDVAVHDEMASTLLGRSVYGPAALLCLEGLPPAEAEGMTAKHAGFEDWDRINLVQSLTD